MMRWLVCMIAASVLVLAGVRPIATLISVGPVRLNAIRMSAPAVWSWLVVSGDQIATEDWTASLLIPGKSRVTLDRQTRVRVEEQAGKVTVALLSGRIGYFVTEPSSLVITSRGGPVVLPQPVGAVSFRSGKLVLEPAMQIPAREMVAPPVLPRLGAYAAAQN